VRPLTLVRIAPVAATSGWGPAADSRFQGMPGLSRGANFQRPAFG
jgi:hypothetical protein